MNYKDNDLTKILVATSTKPTVLNYTLLSLNYWFFNFIGYDVKLFHYMVRNIFTYFL